MTTLTTEDSVIDLTDSFNLIDHCQLANVIIELDDSLENLPVPVRNLRQSKTYTRPQESSAAGRKTLKASDASASSSRPKEAEKCPKEAEKRPKGFGECPVCWDQLSQKPLASTKCGHVFCMRCIRRVVLQTKRCPTCRRLLIGASAYHPLYLSLQ